MATSRTHTGEYKARWKLDANYPVIAPDYSQKRSAMAFRFGLGRKAETPAIPTVDVAPAPQKKKRARVAAPRKKAVDTPAVDPA
ncbi:MucR family transcriptional regulator [Novosphingobium sp.]|uniref:MucR family transcriptional regulator n=1 Tax=Novosphingobium sp. TaxID=1874826 RepID=UPI0038BB2C24